jgi:hypothetical protein
MKLVVLFILLPFSLLAQDLTGVWIGHIQTAESEVRYEVVITSHQKGLKGYAMMTFVNNGVENTGMKSVAIKQKGKEIFLEDGELLYHNYSTPPKRTKLYATLSLREKPEQILWGTFHTRSLDMRARDAYTGQIQLKKQDNLSASLLLPKLKDLNLLNTVSFVATEDRKEVPAVATVNPPAMVAKPLAESGETTVALKPTTEQVTDTVRTYKAELVLGQGKKGAEALPADNLAFKARASSALSNYVSPVAKMKQRPTEVVEELQFETDSVVLTLYDNGEVDGDTVSVFLNGSPVILNQRLTARPITTVIHFDPSKSDSLHLVMFAENLGSIPPNTGLLLLQDSKGRKEVRFSCNLQKNAGIVLRRKRPLPLSP